MNPLTLRKQLLIAESELNRLQFTANVDVLLTNVHVLKQRAQSFRTIASSGAGLVAGLIALKQWKTANATAQTSLLQKVLKTAQLISSVWLIFKSSRGKPEPETESSGS